MQLQIRKGVFAFRWAVFAFSFAMPDVRHATIFFSGRVQGVGFRYAVMQVAKEYEVAGFVMNLPDGRVQLEAEGAADEIDALVAAVEERMRGYIRKVDRSHRERIPQFSGFTIQ
jgi:acylphosphatase